jgi:hypothetical protein
MQCKQCGEPLNMGAEFCAECGADVGAAAFSERGFNQETLYGSQQPISCSPQRKAPVKLPLVIVGAVIVFIAAVVFIVKVNPSLSERIAGEWRCTVSCTSCTWSCHLVLDEDGRFTDNEGNSGTWTVQRENRRDRLSLVYDTITYEPSPGVTRNITGRTFNADVRLSRNTMSFNYILLEIGSGRTTNMAVELERH